MNGNILSRKSIIDSTLVLRIALTGLPIMLTNILLIAIGLFGLLACSSQNGQKIMITETMHQDIPHFKVRTPSATYLISRESGGASSIIDKDGIDWVKHSKPYEGKQTMGSDAEWRGVPQMVFQGVDGGVGHPVGRDMCIVEKVAENQIDVTSKSGLWEFSWTFKEDYAVFSVEKTDSSRAYWFLYEGPVAGNFNPFTNYWATDTDGVRYDQPKIGHTDAVGYWQWACFGDPSVDRSIYVSMADKDTLIDYFAYIGNDRELGLHSNDGMVVFGFGRSNTPREPITRGKNIFLIGFYENKLNSEEVYKEFGNFIDKLNKKYSGK